MARSALATLVATTSLLVAVGCDVKTRDSDIAWADTSAAAMDLMSKPRGTFGINGTPRAAWLDPRPEAEFKREHISGALSLPLGRVDTEHMVALKDRDLIIVYDSEGDDAIAKACAKKLLGYGYKDVYVLRGGLKSWKRDGNATDKG